MKFEEEKLEGPATAAEDTNLLELCKLLQLMLQKHIYTMTSKSLADITKLVTNVSRKLELKRESVAFAEARRNPQFCPICKS